MSWRPVLLLVMTVMLTSCVNVAPPSHKREAFHYLSWQKRQQRLNQQVYFAAKGAFSIVENGRKPVVANYQWIQNKRSHYRIRVSSALNLFNVIIVGRRHSVTLWQGLKKHITAPTPERLLQREMGWTLPIRNLYYWIRGVAAPGAEKITVDQYGHLTTLKQNGWAIRFSHYTTVKGADLPEKIILRRSQIVITIIVKQWTLTQRNVLAI